jgi:hypothetical protein
MPRHADVIIFSMLPYRDSRIVTIAIILFFILAASYAVFEAQGLLFGPRIDVSGAQQEVHDPFVTISGTTQRISSLTMQGQAIQVTQTGNFSEPYLLSPGLNRIVLEAADKYGRTSRQVLQIVYTPSTDSGQAPATDSTSSPQASTSESTSAEATSTATSTGSVAQ